MTMNTGQTATPKTPQQLERTAKGIALLRSTYKSGCDKLADKKRAKSENRKPNHVPHVMPTGWFVSKDGVKVHA